MKIVTRKNKRLLLLLLLKCYCANPKEVQQNINEINAWIVNFIFT